ncbi:MAG TPA: hypothetical protein DGT23_34235 [Micromonosporaceae bacterium]|nr:hypothetical protein [Micromonosporaceae bacterium]
MKNFVSWYRVGLGLLALAALATQFVHSSRSSAFSEVNFFSYFTNLSNIVGALLFIYCGLRAEARSLTIDLLRGAATVYLATTGVVYNLLLTNVGVGIVIPWVNTVIHAVMPLAAVIDWLVVAPSNRLRFKQTWVWLIFPLAYLAYILIRGPIVNWYPYPFLDPKNVGGYAGVAAYSVGITAALVGLVFGVMWLGNRQRRAKA